MTVKINDSKMFDAYAEGVASGYDAVESVQSFVENYSPSYATAIGDYQAVINAILNDESVQLCQPEYRVRLTGFAGSDGQQFVTRSSNGDGYFICGENNPSVIRGDLLETFSKNEAMYIRKLIIQATVEEVK
ncbi:MAG: hypothetical protein LKJ43_03070 [Lentilactobacillus buchneri]|jgi:hypothetical protein|nr:hypothetical protein [Lentilactobacillus buchneri]MCI1950693.1 hypothetical protein [Lentilactobacillus buchneri]MCI2018230.1 hypothetical protein [Lentilactobacillus buchneri]MCI2027819.1 hypothetical protein [Lentilactobacillus buchneri]